MQSNAKEITRSFENGNVGVFGKKRKGKDLLFQKIISMRKNQVGYYSNIDYGFNKIKLIDPSEMKYGPNTYDNFINGTLTKIERSFVEKADIYISDSGNIFPSQYEKLLDKKYPGTPLFVSLQGHTYDSNTHFNWNGSYTRLWKKVREQIDDMYKALGKVNIFGLIIFAKYRYFEKPESAELNLLPYKKNRLLDSKQNKSLREQYHATNGLIKDMWVYLPKRILKYDTRAFEKVIFKEDSERVIKYVSKGELGE